MRALLVSVVWALCSPGLRAQAGYLRTPDVHGELVVFAAEGDLWLVPVEGGEARRLTSHEGEERSPRFSPDGRLIAFSAEYDGNTDVFVVGASGGEPRRLTWHPAGDGVLGWTPDGARILFASNRYQPHGSTEIFAVPVDGGEPERLPLGWASFLSMEPDGTRWAFTRTRGGGTWKRYRGGTAESIWVGDPERADFRKVTDFDGMCASPLWYGGRIFYLCDRGGTANLWSMAPDGTDPRQHTDLGNWDARHPSMAPDGRVVFTLAGDIALYDPRDETLRTLPIHLPSDRVLTRSRYPDAARNLTWFDLSPDAERVAVTTRGEVFSVPVEDGVTLPVSRGSGARESWASFGPEGKRLVFVTDEPGEEEIRTVDAWGRGEATVVLAAAESGWHHPPAYSPDGKWIASADQTQSLFVLPAEGGEPRTVDRCEEREITEYAWSPDGRWLAYAKGEHNQYRSLYVYSVESGETRAVTTRDTDDGSPCWDPEGRYLYFLSNRSTNPLLGARDLENVDILPTRPYALLLTTKVKHPFAGRAGLPPQEGEEDGEEEEKDADGAAAGKDGGASTAETSGDADGEKKDGEKKKDRKPVEIDFDGILERVVEFPVDAGQYHDLRAVKGKVFYLSDEIEGMASDDGPFGESESGSTLVSFDLKKKKAETFLKGVRDYRVAPEANKVAVRKGRGELLVVEAGSPPGADLSEARVSLEAVVVELDPREEWGQIFHEGWRHMRDFYWDAGLAGVDWEAVRDQYATLLPRLATRGDLRDLMAEMIGELATSHTYTFGGDQGVDVERVSVGLLGADLSRVGEAFRVDRIYRGAPADRERSPLLEPGSAVREGEYVLAVNHLPFRADRPFCAHLEGLANREVLLTVNSEPRKEGARDVVVVPLGDDSGLRYADWVRCNREFVEEHTDGKIGYVHLPDMGSSGLVEFNTWFYPQLDREGMVVDVRWNGGGFVSQMILERFRRRVISFDRARGGAVSTYPARVLNGPFVVLTNEHAGSDGDIFPAAVQLEGLAPVIGMRSWGGVIGIRMDKRMVDGGMLTQPEFAWWDPRNGWELENRGVQPDIVVQNLPQELARGVDAQLERAIVEVLQLHAENPPLHPAFGPARPRGRDAYQGEIGAK